MDSYVREMIKEVSVILSERVVGFLEKKGNALEGGDLELIDAITFYILSQWYGASSDFKEFSEEQYTLAIGATASTLRLLKCVSSGDIIHPSLEWKGR